MQENSKYTVLVTGFGPFGEDAVNASWQSVKKLKELFDNLVDGEDINLIVKEIPVAYEYVATKVPELWEKFKPNIVIHVGVSDNAKSLVIEQKAHNCGYSREDIYNRCPDEITIKSKAIESSINISQLCEHLNNLKEGSCTVSTSTNAGRYLCEYIYYQSLSINPTKTLFIHCPKLTVYPAEKTAKGICDIINYLINTLKEKK
ncbi:pyroglutamyl-peptidase 1 [Prorops nasuta]|uniref:pyroglutamyl-peptidase 1 n=1 Tax=Prorops nasuta TaxID=863751 RepID=UPI0034CE774C